MKKSNRILLGGFLSVILLITGIHLTLYAKYKNGQYTVYHSGDKNGQTIMQSFQNISTVTLRNCVVNIEFGDVLSVEKGKEKIVGYLQQGDSLVITGQRTERFPGNQSGVKITLPYNATLFVHNSNVFFKKGKANEPVNLVAYLNNTSAQFVFSQGLARFRHIKVNASDNSSVAFHGDIEVAHLEAELKNSSLEYERGDIGALSIATDSVSQLKIQSRYLLKAKITSIPGNP